MQFLAKVRIMSSPSKIHSRHKSPNRSGRKRSRNDTNDKFPNDELIKRELRGDLTLEGVENALTRKIEENKALTETNKELIEQIARLTKEKNNLKNELFEVKDKYIRLLERNQKS